MAKYRTKNNNRFLIVILGILCLVGLVWYMTRPAGGAALDNGLKAIELSEIMSSNKGAVIDTNGNYPDWIEVHNCTDESLNIGGYGLSDDVLSAAKWTFPTGTVIEPYGYLVVYCSGNAGDGPMHAGFKLNATDSVVLSSTSGAVIESVQLRRVVSGASLAKDDQGGWRDARPSPGYANTIQGAEQYQQDMTVSEGQDVGVYINEFMASNASTLIGPDGSYCDWIELYNTNAGPVDLSGFGISDELSQPMKYKLPVGTSIEGYGVLLIYCTGRQTQAMDKIEAPFGLAAYKEDVVLSNQQGKILDSFSYEQMETDASMARMPDGTGSFSVTTQPTPGFTNNQQGRMGYLSSLNYGQGPIILSEAMNANYSFLKQADQEFYDWIEVANTSPAAVNLRGWALSKNAKNPAKWVFPDVILEPNEHLVIMASGKNLTDGQKKNELATNFRLSGDGETLFLFNPEHEIADKLSLGALNADVSYGRTGDKLLYYDKPTPGEPNAGGKPGYAEKPVIELAPGKYDGAQSVNVILSAGTNATYTLDGTEPTPSSKPVNGPIPITKTTGLRVRAFQDSFFASDTATASYIIYNGTDTVEDHRSTGLPVMSIVSDPDNFWDPDTGIYVLGNRYATATGEDATGVTMEGLMNHEHSTLANFWQSWERPMHFDLIDAEGKLEYSQDAVVRIFGAYSRAKEQKPLAIIARPGYGGSRLNHAFFENRPYQDYKSLVLRPSAQDNTYSRIRDIVVTSLFEDGGNYGLPASSQIYVQAYRQMVVYLNGEYRGVYNLREKITSNFLAQHYGLNNPDVIDILMGNGNDKCVIAGNGWREYTDMVEWADTNDLSNPENYAKICSQIDEKNLALYTAAEIIVGNTDTGNIKYWRTKETDNRWRWLFYDFCWAMNRDDDSSDAYSSGPRRDFFAKYFDEKGHGASKSTSTKLIRALLKNPTWKQLLLDYSAYLFREVYTTEKIIARVDECQQRISSEMKYDVELWSGISYKSWGQHCDNIRNYAKTYPNYYLKYAQNFFDLSDSEMKSTFGAVTTLSN